jgi:tetratricopeptide (TPR) repeat protein
MRIACAALALAALCAGRAEAQPSASPAPSPADVAKSRELFEQGRARAQAGDYRSGCPLLQAANDLNRTNGTALSLADCYEKLGQPERALPHYRSIVETGDPKFPDRVAHAQARVLAIEATQPPPASSAPAPTAPPPPAPVPSATSSATPPPIAPEPPSRVPIYVAFGVGAAGVAVGSIFGALALSQASDVEDACPGGKCGRNDQVGPQADAQDAARTKAWVSTIGFGVGVIGVAAGIVLLATQSEPSAVRADARGLEVRF